MRSAVRSACEILSSMVFAQLVNVMMMMMVVEVVVMVMMMMGFVEVHERR